MVTDERFSVKRNQFDPVTAAEVSRETYAPKSDAGNWPPRISFAVSPGGGVMKATPPMAMITAEWINSQTSDLTIRDVRGDTPGVHVATVTVRAHGPYDLTTETIAIASAIYWSWWRALDMRGEIPR